VGGTEQGWPTGIKAPAHPKVSPLGPPIEETCQSDAHKKAAMDGAAVRLDVPGGQAQIAGLTATGSL